jgi:ADP-ribose pyrophosphatase YjhB (NUDIX family)
MFQYCPSCGKPGIQYKGNRFDCPDCGFVYYHNTAAATGCIISIPAPQGLAPKLMFLVRGKEPQKGKLDLPGGFVDPGENILEGLYRELKEEIGWVPPVSAEMPLTRSFQFFASFPNIYPYKNIAYNTCDIFFTVCAPGLSEQDLRLEKSEISGVCFLKPEEIDFDRIAFESMKQAIREYLKSISF